MNPRHKYPRTPHLPWSPGATDDDVRIYSCQDFEGFEVVVTEKMDGENTSLYRDGLHARSIDGRHHPSRDWLKAWHGNMAHEIPNGWRLCGENLYARHSLAYRDLAGFFYLFSVWDDANRCLTWDETKEWGSLLGCPTPRELFRGLWQRRAIEKLVVNPATTEGYVVRNADSFAFADFTKNVAKWVRPHHVQTDEHWMHASVVANELAHSSTSALPGPSPHG